MSGINKAILIGNLGKDPEVKTFESGKKKATFSIATTEKYKDKETTEWHNIAFWGSTADVVEKYLKKGSKVYVEGKITTRTWEKDGETRYSTEILGNSLTMLSKAEYDNDIVSEKKEQKKTKITSDEEDDDLPF